jgi:hypothetical protein
MAIIMIFAYSCSSVKQEEKQVTSHNITDFNQSIFRMESDCIINSTLNNQSFNFRAKVNISGTDTISMVLYGPFGITVGKLFSDLNNFSFYNILENTVYKGAPTQENIKKATNLSISMKDFLCLFQGKTPFPVAQYSTVDSDDKKKLILKRIDKQNFADFAVIDNQKMDLMQYQRKDKGDILIMNTLFSNFQKIEKANIPFNINLLMPTVDGKLILEVEDCKINQNAESPSKFNIPKSVKIIELN